MSIQIPSYIQDKNPYKREFYAGFDETLTATKNVLKNWEWTITRTADPSVFEETPQDKNVQGKEILLFTGSKQTSLFLFSRYTQLNIYLRALKNTTEVEVRYSAVIPLSFKQFRSYRNNRFVKKFFGQIARQLEK